MKLAGAAFLDAYGGRYLNTHPALLPSFPGMHGAADALEHGVKVTGATLFVVDAGVDTGPIVAQTVVPVEDDDDVESLHERIKAAERVMLVESVGRLAREGFTIEHRKVRIGMMSRRPGRIAIRRALVSVYDKTGLEDLVRGLHDAGVALVSTGGSAALIEKLGLPVTKVEDLTGFPECLDGRVKTLHPKVHAGILADRRLESHVQQLADLGVEPFDLVVSNLYPFTETVMSGAAPRRVRGADRHRRPVDGARGREEPPVGRDRHLARPLRRRAGRGRRRRVHAGRAPAARGGGVRAHRDVRRARGVVDGQRAHRHVRGDRLPGLDGRDVGPQGGAALRREPAPERRALHQRLRAGARAGAGDAAARQGDVLQQLRRRRRGPAGGVRLRRAGRRDHQARQPVRDRGRRRRRRGAPQGARVRPDVGVRRRDRDQPPVSVEMADPGGRDLHRGAGRAVVRRGCGGGAPGQEEHPAARVRAAAARRQRPAVDLRRAAAAGARRGRRRGRRPGVAGPSPAARRSPTPSWPTSRSRGAPAVR